MICDFDFFSTVGGGQVFYRRLVERNPGSNFFYPSRGPDFVLEADGRLPGNARPFTIGDTAVQDVLHMLGDCVPLMTRDHARLLANIAAAVHRVPPFDRRLMLRAHWCLPSVGSIVRRSAVAAIGGRDMTFRFVSDFDFWLRLTAHGPLLQIPRKLASWRLHQSNLTNSGRRREMADERIRLLDRLFADPEEQARSAADRPTAYAAAHLCAAALLNRTDDARALQHLSSAAELDGDLCRDLPPNMTGYPPFWPDGYRQALAS